MTANSESYFSTFTFTSDSSTCPPFPASLPVFAQLQFAASAIQSPSNDLALKVAWCRDVFFLIDRSNQECVPCAEPPVGPVSITGPTISMRATLAATGAFPDYVCLNPRNAFPDFESAVTPLLGVDLADVTHGRLKIPEK